ncbi:MAG: precorrin-2 dehydrogenase/sirohydrochlorin ferrochelatase family protein [Bradymonadaceae bacterium]
MSGSTPQFSLYPIFLKLEDALCIVVGGGAIGAQKARELVAVGAHVRCISPEFSSAWEALDGVERVTRTYRPGDLRGARLVITATADPEVDEVIYEEAIREGALVNVVDVVERCQFYAGAVVHRGPVTIAIGTSGTSPSLARILRERIDAWLPRDLGDLAGRLGAVRPALLVRHPDYKARARILYACVSRAFDHLESGGSLAAVGSTIDAIASCAGPCQYPQHCHCLEENQEDISC